MFCVKILNAQNLLLRIASISQIKAFQLIKASTYLCYLDYLKINKKCIYDIVKDSFQMILGERNVNEIISGLMWCE